MTKPNEYITDLFHKLRDDISWIKQKLFTEKPKLESSDTPKEYVVNAIHTDDNADGKTDDSKTIVRATLNMPKAIRIEAETHERPKKWRKDRMFLVQIAAVLAASTYVGIAYLQWRDLGDNFKFSQRAWLKVDAGFPDKEPPVYGVTMRVENVGKSVAHNVHLIGRLEYDPGTTGPNLEVKGVAVTDVTYGLIFPADHHDYPMQFTDDKAKPRALSGDELKQLALGNAYLSLFGIIGYEDEFGKHWTKFCQWRDYAIVQGPTINSRNCISWNSVGEGDPPTH
jgi:hypothetical protein